METTARAFLDHWSWAAEKGVMNRNTAAGLRAACTQVLSVLENWESVDIKALDIEDTLSRFQNLKKKDFKPAVLETYKRRFRQAIGSYLSYLDDPGGWRPKTAERAGGGEPRTGTEPPAEGRRLAPQRATAQAGMVDYPFPLPLREGQDVRLSLPRDLKVSEVKRLTAFLMSLAIDAEIPST